ncbi:unnamed protein product [Menidia menidia]|uniref:(Atlantic silverside) hypothetical protein n=1 Tax=Menidia menidia TaxID=238744 RepID=A0A8S4BBY5_9TELE|nr:unnamed protein product [Menidia menidia]
MKVLWISCLLIGSITCFPSQSDQRPSWTTTPSWPYFLPAFSFPPPPSKPSYMSPTELSDHFHSHRSLYGSSDPDGADDEDSHFLDQNLSPEGPGGDQGPGYAEYVWGGEPDWVQTEKWSSDPSEDDNEPFFIDMSNQDPSFTLNAHSDYHQQRKVVTRARFTPRHQSAQNWLK